MPKDKIATPYYIKRVLLEITNFYDDVYVHLGRSGYLKEIQKTDRINYDHITDLIINETNGFDTTMITRSQYPELSSYFLVGFKLYFKETQIASVLLYNEPNRMYAQYKLK